MGGRWDAEKSSWIRYERSLFIESVSYVYGKRTTPAMKIFSGLIKNAGML